MKKVIINRIRKFESPAYYSWQVLEDCKVIEKDVYTVKGIIESFEAVFGLKINRKTIQGVVNYALRSGVNVIFSDK